MKTPPKKKLVDCKWVFKVKKDENGKKLKKKARLVNKGFSQQYEIDYEEIFSPVMKMMTFISIMTFKNLYIRYADFKSAYLQLNMTETNFLLFLFM